MCLCKRERFKMAANIFLILLIELITEKGKRERETKRATKKVRIIKRERERERERLIDCERRERKR